MTVHVQLLSAFICKADMWTDPLNLPKSKKVEIAHISIQSTTYDVTVLYARHVSHGVDCAGLAWLGKKSQI